MSLLSEQTYVSDILAIDHAFGNIFDVVISNLGITNRASSVEFTDEFGFTTEFDEAIQMHKLGEPNRIKAVTITFLEGSDYKVLIQIQNWMDQIYDFENRYFKSDIKTATITITDINSDEKYILTEVLPTSLSYPEYAWSSPDPIKITATFSINGDIQ